jgi:hypothetical protein
LKRRIVSHLGYGNWWSNDTWAGTSQSLIPNLLGFSLGTYAILFSLMTGRFKHALRVVKKGQDVTLIDGINVAFFHVILVQVSALVWAWPDQGPALFDLMQTIQPHGRCIAFVFAILKALGGGGGGGGIGFVLLIYSITLIVGSAAGSVSPCIDRRLPCGLSARLQ